MDVMKKVLYISYDGMTDPLGQSQVIPYLSGLTRSGYKFFILSFEKRERFEKEKGVINNLCDKAGITWVPLPFHTNPPVAAKVYDRIVMKKKAVQLHEAHHFDMIHCRSYPAAEVGLYLKQRTGVHFLFDMRGFWPDEKLDSGHWDQKRPWFRWMYQYYKKLEKHFLNESDHIISLTAAGKKELVRRYGPQYKPWAGAKKNVASAFGEKISVIPTCADLDHFDFHKVNETDQQALRKKLGIREGQKVLSYSGSLGTWYMMNEMLQFFKVYREKYTDAVFLCLTKEPKAVMDDYISRNGVDPSSVITGFSNRGQLPLHLSLSTCSVFFIRATYSKISSSPTKYAELMGLGVPVVCNDIGDTGSIVEATRSGVLVSGFTVEAYRKAVNQIAAFTANDQERIRSAAFGYFDLQLGIESYRNVYDGIMQEQTVPA
jgi:glycosyltransferase involved in cell wall biosynthesis